MKAKLQSRTSPPAAAPRRTAASPGVTGRNHLFVYGTLKRGGKFHRQLLKAGPVEFLGAARIQGELYELPGVDFPGAVATSSPNRFVDGQVFLLTNPLKTLATLDEFEEVGTGLFRRDLVDVWVKGRRTKAWVYFYARSVAGATPVSPGVYSSR